MTTDALYGRSNGQAMTESEYRRRARFRKAGQSRHHGTRRRLKTFPRLESVDRRSTIVDISTLLVLDFQSSRVVARRCPEAHAVHAVGGVRRIIMIVVGWVLTCTSAAVGIGLALRLYDRLCTLDTAVAEVAAAAVAPPEPSPSPAAETIGPSEEPVAEPAAKPPVEVSLSCRDKRFRDIRRAVLKYCRAPNLDDFGTFLCPDLPKRLDCESYLLLTHEPQCHPGRVYRGDRPRTLCHDFLASLSPINEDMPYIALNRSAGRWKVVEIEYDDLERP
jgi:hypothetical protein